MSSPRDRQDSAKDGKVGSPRRGGGEDSTWKCPRHAVACDCARTAETGVCARAACHVDPSRVSDFCSVCSSPRPISDDVVGEGNRSLDELIRGIWKTDSDREAVSRKVPRLVL
jgi:hypothetical protein